MARCRITSNSRPCTRGAHDNENSLGRRRRHRRSRAFFFSHTFFATLAKGLTEPPAEDQLYAVLGEKLPFDFPSREHTELAGRWVEELDRHSIARTVLIASVPGDEDSVAAAVNAQSRPFHSLLPC